MLSKVILDIGQLPAAQLSLIDDVDMPPLKLCHHLRLRSIELLLEVGYLFLDGL